MWIFYEREIEQDNWVMSNENSDALREFITSGASPPCWYEVAKGLHESAKTLNNSGSSQITLIKSNGDRTQRNENNRSVFLLAGFALENLLKSFLIYENPSYISNGVLAKKIKSHSLTGLQKMCNTVPYKNRWIWVLSKFEDGLESWARYPCGLTFRDSCFEEEMTPKLWDGYNKLFSAYSKRIEKLLSKPFSLPHGETARMKYKHY